jgi:hypothetical protein
MRFWCDCSDAKSEPDRQAPFSSRVSMLSRMDLDTAASKEMLRGMWCYNYMLLTGQYPWLIKDGRNIRFGPTA